MGFDIQSDFVTSLLQNRQFENLIFFTCISLLLKSFSLCSNPKEKNVLATLEIKFIALDISRATLFHIIVILFQEQQILQCLLISISSIAQCCIIYKYKLCSHIDRIIYLIIEGVLTVFSLSLFLYFDIGEVYLSYDNKIALGFIQMGFLIMSLGIVFIKQLFPKIQKIRKLVCEQKKVQVASSQLFS
ncbi:unnamed protein product (macronuclear) [Paramecium tetraurelia]|uniref:Transmembrane protein n=1 Tax=Paramecium tetraurelia TaxID=5888 RepID=A0CTR6_PARTE|nr:uncharacterized protein GSPATT00010417001 [Paramecium tetraurelia]CAK74183.1 unnamed protein product [Paramecium tetraurelia]|eukprot:XP_001441580.1 hypothetical protein (macronuclear) [Paramecium tetraurelia strain d4-2]